MARPRELFNTPAPQAMSQMGQGIAEAYANVGRVQGQGMAALGQGIAQGINQAASAYGDYKKMQSQVKSSENFYNTMKEGGYLPPKMTKGIDTMVDGDVYKNMGTAEKAQFWGDVKGYTGSALGQYYKMQQIQAAHGPKKMPTNLGSIEKGIDDILNFNDDGFSPRPVTPLQAQPQPNAQDITQPATELADFIRRRLGYIPSVIPPALMAEYNASIGR
jgi:hypothetical protein